MQISRAARPEIACLGAAMPKESASPKIPSGYRRLPGSERRTRAFPDVAAV